MPVRVGGSWIIDPESGELTPNIPADAAAETAPAAGVVVTTNPPRSEMSPEAAAAVGKLIEVASAELATKSETRRAAPKKES